MKFSTIVFTLFFALITSIRINALPSKRDGLSDVEILNTLLMVKHIPDAFYSEGLAEYSQADFTAAGYPDWVYSRFEEVATHGKTHVEFLRTALGTAGVTPVEPCQYTFHNYYNDVKSFINTASAIENMVISAYTSAPSSIANKEYQTVITSISGVESRHIGWINSAVRKGGAWDTAFETPLNINQVYTMISHFTESCPASNPTFPIKSFPTLNIDPLCSLGPAQPPRVKLTFDPSVAPCGKPLYVAFISGMETIFRSVDMPTVSGGEYAVTIPEELEGFVYAVLTRDDKVVDEATTVAGPAFVQFGHDDSVGRVMTMVI